MEVVNQVLNYKDLKIVQDSDGFKFSLDSVLLANFVSINLRSKKILDIGCGNGIISILLSQKTKACITGVEIQNESYELAQKSVEINGLSDRISIINADIKELYKNIESDSFDVIVSNPPYFSVKDTSLKNLNANKMQARHELSLNYKDVIIVAKKLLKNNGNLALVHRPDKLLDILDFMRANNIEPKKIRFVYPYKGKSANMLLIEGTKNGKTGLKVLDPLYVYENSSYTEEVSNYFN